MQVIQHQHCQIRPNASPSLPGRPMLAASNCSMQPHHPISSFHNCCFSISPYCFVTRLSQPGLTAPDTRRQCIPVSSSRSTTSQRMSRSTGDGMPSQAQRVFGSGHTESLLFSVGWDGHKAVESFHASGSTLLLHEITGVHDNPFIAVVDLAEILPAICCTAEGNLQTITNRYHITCSYPISDKDGKVQ